ncbi:MAG: hypothetical protein UX69_C0009G0009 [candidate division WWE3 bacterium GW2011_GWA2_46_9]|nr:MAG: hypothetical protein UX69_C0009G0009 [candidate division WWE3 bacterium GW2011_GWA2_46_9]
MFARINAMESLPAQNPAQDQQPPVKSPLPKQTTKKYMSNRQKLGIMGGVVLVITICVFAILFFISSQKQELPAPPTYTLLQSDIMSEWIRYENSRFNFAVTRPKEITLYEPTNQNTNPEVYKFVYTGTTQKEQNPDKDENLTDGFILNVLVHKNLQNTDILDLATKKRQNYVINCPRTALVSQQKDEQIAKHTSKSFEVTDCIVNYKETFVRDRGIVFELVQIYKGDLGFKQAYKSKIQEVQNTFEFINIPASQVEWKIVTDDSHAISFEHPSLDASCCKIQSPAKSQTIDSIGIYTDKNTVKEGTNAQFDGFGVFVEKKPAKMFDAYVEDQKNALLEDYRLVVGRNPTALKEEKIVVDGVEGTLLKGFAWWADELVYVPHKSKSTIVIIVKTQQSGGSFDETFGKVLETFKFTKG